MLWGFNVPGMRTSWSDELATTLGVAGVPQPLTNAYPRRSQCDR